MRTQKVRVRAVCGRRLSQGVRSIAEPLESRLLFSQLNSTVTTIADSGPGSLRQAILDANAQPGYRNVIDFDISPSGPATITPTSPLPTMTSHIEIHGTTGGSGEPLIELDGHLAGKNASGLVFDRSAPADTLDAIVSGLLIEHFALDGIDIAGEGHIEVFGCRIGVDFTGRSALANGRDGIRIYSPNNTIGLPYSGAAFMNVISGNKDNGISIFGGASGNNVVQNNFIGLSANGANAIGNTNYGVWLDTSGCLIGGTISGSGNVISGNRFGIYSSSVNGPKSAGPNQIMGNKIGTNAAGSAAVSNGVGIFIADGKGTQIGNSLVASRNIISGNAIGIDVQDVAVSIANAYVGTDVSGAKSVGNGENGIYFSFTNGSTVDSCVVSGNGLNDPNNSGGISVYRSQNVLIQHCIVGANAAKTGPIPNADFGVEVISSTGTVIKYNTIAYNGVKPTGMLGSFRGAGVYELDATIDHSTIRTHATIGSNNIYSNFGLGIELGPTATPLPNDPGDADTGPNDLLNYAVLTSATVGTKTTTVKGTFNGAANANFRLELFSNTAADPSGYGEGQKYLAYITIKTNSAGNATFSASVARLTKGLFITSTITDAAGNTSEFSNAIKTA